MTKRWIWALLAIPLAIAGTGCDSDDDGSDRERPEVIAFSLPDSATDIGLVAPVTVTFSDRMDPASVTAETISLTARPSRGHVRYDPAARVALFTPDTLYPAETWLRLSVSGATDEAGNEVEPAALDFLTGPFDCAHLADPREPNEETASAAEIATGVVHPSLTVCAEETDTYSFTLAQAAKITARTDIHAAFADSAGEYNGWQIHFLNAGGGYYATLGTRADPSYPQTFHYSFLPGTYYLEIYSSIGVDPGEFVLYDLTLEVGAPCADDPFEDNDFYAQAADVAPGLYTGLKGCHVDADYYCIAMEAGQTLTLTVDAVIPDGGWGHRRLQIQAPGASVSYDGEDNPATAQATATADGDAVVQARFWVDGVTYALDLALTD